MSTPPHLQASPQAPGPCPSFAFSLPLLLCGLSVPRDTWELPGAPRGPAQGARERGGRPAPGARGCGWDREPGAQRAAAEGRRRAGEALCGVWGAASPPLRAVPRAVAAPQTLGVRRANVREREPPRRPGCVWPESSLWGNAALRPRSRRPLASAWPPFAKLSEFEEGQMAQL